MVCGKLKLPENEILLTVSINQYILCHLLNGLFVTM